MMSIGGTQLWNVEHSLPDGIPVNRRAPPPWIAGRRTGFSLSAPIGLCLVAGLLLVARTLSAQVVYDAAADLLADETLPGAENGRNGVWTYGGYDTRFGTFTPFTAAQHINTWPVGIANPPPVGTFQGYGSAIGDQTPALVVNTNTTTAYSPGLNAVPISPGKLCLHPSSPDGNTFGDLYDVPVVRWTAPAAGLVNLAAVWIQRMDRPQEGRVLTNGVTLFSGVDTWEPGISYSVSNLLVAPGDTIDVGVAPGPQQYYSGVTEVDLHLTFRPTQPQPIGIRSQPTNLTVWEGAAATFRVAVTNYDPVGYQWQRGSNNIPQATDPVYALPRAALSDAGSWFRCVLTNPVSTNISANALLTVLADTNPPALVSARNEGSTTIVVMFSEPVDAASATNRANYGLDHGATVSAAVLGPDNATVLLATSPLASGVLYTLTVNQVRDRAAAGNPIPPNSRIAFFVLDYQPRAIGSPTTPGSLTFTNGSYALSAGGKDIGGAADECLFAAQSRVGDFDIEVRIESLSLADAWAKAGLMARETTNANSRFVSVLAAPSVGGSWFLCRANPGEEAAASGGYPVNYPDTWLRLRRAGNQFTGYASVDGQNWAQLGAVSLALPATLYFGMVVASHNSGQAAVALFDEPGPCLGSVSGGAVAPFEPLSASSRRTGIVISEILYHPGRRADGRELEFIELFNPQSFDQDLGGYRISGSVDFVFPAGTILRGGGYLVVARSPSDLEAAYGLGGVLGPFTNNLPNGPGTVALRNELGWVLLEVNYASEAPWPSAADGTGHSLVLSHPTCGEGDPRAWALSAVVGGSPGRAEHWSTERLGTVVINEYLAHSVSPWSDFIELYNAGSQPVDLSGAWLSDDFSTNKFRIADGTVLGPRGFARFDETELGFALSGEGEEIVLVNSNRTRVIDALRFGGQAPNVSRGRSPDGSQLWSELAVPTPGTNNAAPLLRDLVINEILFDPISGSREDEYVELYNRGSSPVNLRNWRLSGGVQFLFPDDLPLAPGGWAVVAANLTNLLARYPNLTRANTVGDYSGSLKNQGERLALEMPLVESRTNAQGVVTTNLSFVTVGEVTYNSGGRWGRWAGGGGSSLELTDPRSDPRFAANWADSIETAKAQWTNIEVTGVLDLGNANYAATNLQILLLGKGECLVDEVEVLSGGSNLVANGTFESGTNGWIFEGNHEGTTLEAIGFNSMRSLRLRASGDGDSYGNRVLTPLTGAIPAGNTATLRAKARWLCGHPEILLRLRGNWLEAAGALPVPANCGTPAAVNSRAVANAGPAISEVTHSPVLPAAAQSTVVTARVRDPDGVLSVLLKYRLDPSGTYATVTMADDGAGADPLAGDGLFSAALPGQAAGSIVAFYIEATDRHAQPATTRFPADAPARECLVRFGEVRPFGSFGTYRLWLTQAAFNRWSNRSGANKEPLDATFVVDPQRVIYNIGAYYSGSPAKVGSFNTPAGNPCDYHLTFPPDDRLLGATSAEVAFPGNLNGDVDGTALREQVSYWIARRLGLPANERRFVNLLVNGTRRGAIVEDAQEPNGDLVEQLFPGDSEGDLLKSTIWWEVDQGQPELRSGWGNSIAAADLTDYLTTGNLRKTARYRWNFVSRGMGRSANDYSRFFGLVAALNSPSATYTAAVEASVAVEEWMGVFAYEHLVGQWDSLGYRSSANMYFYKGAQGRWTLMPWDVDISFVADGPRSDLFAASYPVMQRLIAHPPFCRAYWRALEDAANGPLTAEESGAMIDARHAALRANGIAADAPDAIKSYLSQRRAYVLEQLATVAAPFAITGPVEFNATSNLVTLRGTGPIALETLTLNGAAWPVTWTSVTNWELRLALAPGTNQLVLAGWDRRGQPIAGAAATLRINCSGASESPLNQIVFSEILSHPAVAGAEFVELHNLSVLSAFDLSGWRIEGVDCDIPQGTVIGPGADLVFVRDPIAFAAAYGASTPFAGVFAGRLGPAGEILKLVRPGGADEPVDQVRYEDSAPWPTTEAGVSLQLVDPAQDNARVANWAAVTNNTPAPPAWHYATATGTASSSSLYVYLQAAGDVYLDDVKLVAGRTAETGPSLLAGGDFETAFPGPWGVSPNHAASGLSSSVKHAGEYSLHLVASSGGVSRTSAVYQDLDPALTNGAPYTLSYWYRSGTNGGTLTLRLSGSGITSTATVAPENNTYTGRATPGASNVVRRLLPSFPQLWLNEVQPDNVSGPLDGAGHRHPWVELLNAGSSNVSLDKMLLTDDYAAPAKWAFPSNASILPGRFLVVWCGGNTNESTNAELHTSFPLRSGTGAIALSRRLDDGTLQILDYLNYAELPANRSYGDVPDGQPFTRQAMFYATPGGTNEAAEPSTPLFISEWMASNTRTLPNPVGGAYDDWFELYNPNPFAVDLAGWSLANSYTNPAQNVIPSGYFVPALGYLLVWADGKPGRNSPSHPDLHINFKLNRDGETIALYAPDGRLVDGITFGPQASDVSQGRYPAGGAYIYSLAAPTPRAANVFVPPAPAFCGAVPSGTQITLTSTATPGCVYRWDYRDQLDGSDWIPLTPPATATHTTISVMDSLTGRPRRFYRVVLLPW